MSELYTVCAKCLQDIVIEGCALKSSVYSNIPREKKIMTKKVMKIVSSIIDNYELLVSTIEDCGLLRDFPRYSPQKKIKQRYEKIAFSAWLSLVISFDYLFSKNGIVGGGRLKNTVLKSLKVKYPRHGLLANFRKFEQSDANKDEIPKYIRFDTHYVNKNDLIRTLNQEFNINAVSEDLFDGVLRLEGSLSTAFFAWLKNQQNKLCIMDKASCLSAKLLHLNVGDIVIDCCASPGSKTLSFLAKLHNNGCVISIEKDPGRYHTLVNRISESVYFDTIYTLDEHQDDEKLILTKVNGTDNKKPIHLLKNNQHGLTSIIVNNDLTSLFFCNTVISNCVCEKKSLLCLNHLLSYYPNSFSSDNKIVSSLDPSCSGLLNHKNSKISNKRLNNLTKFQKILLKHILNWNVLELVTYSSCSVFQEENIEVIIDVLENNTHYKSMMPQIEWQNSKLQSLKMQTDKKYLTFRDYLSANFETNNCRGFFICLLQKTDNGN